MYINFTLAGQKKITPQWIMWLQILQQGRSEDLSQLIEQEIGINGLKALEAGGLVSYVKPKSKKDLIFSLARLSDKGKELLNELQEAPIEEQDDKIFLWLSAHYKKLDKDIGNGARTKRHIRDFRIQSGVEKNNLIKLCLDFLAENEERSRTLEYVFYYPKTAFATKFNLEDSWLYKHLEKNRERLEKTFEKYE